MNSSPPQEVPLLIAPLLILLVALPVTADDKPLSELWTLEYFPDNLPNLPDEVYGKTWGHQPPRSRTGRGYSDFLTFRKPADGRPAEVVWRQVSHPRAGQQDRETTRILALRVETSLLEFGGELHTAVVHDDVLALNAGVPVDDRSWYVVQCDTFTDRKVRVSEYLFEFDDDPRTADGGKVTVKHASNLFPSPHPEKWTQVATFDVDKTSDKYRTLVLRSIAAPGRPRSNLPKLLLWTDRPYLSLNEPNAAVIEYRLQK
jgi:hypothetical protein